MKPTSHLDTELRTAWLQMHFCVLLWGFTAILGKLISLPALPLVFWRMVLSALFLLILPRIWKSLSNHSPGLLLGLSGIGILIALHWIGFYGAVKLANASVAATCMSVTPAFTSLVEPIITGKRFSWNELMLGILVIPGMLLVVGGTPNEMNLGILVGLGSAFFGALFSTCNKRIINRSDPLSATSFEMASGSIFVLLILYLSENFFQQTPLIQAFISSMTAFEALFSLPSWTDMAWLVVLIIACTILPFTLSLKVLRHLSAFSTNLAVNMEPIYTILLAMIFLGEQRELDISFYLGAGVILTVVFLHSRSGGSRSSS